MTSISTLLSRIRGDRAWLNRLDEAEAAALVESDCQRLLLGDMLARSVAAIENPQSLQELEFAVFSQFGDDGIIQWLVHKLQPASDVFVEFGVSNYRESNTRFLLIHNNWSGLVLDGSESNVEYIKCDEISWKYDLQSQAVFITAENINEVIASHGIRGDIGLLHIDLDGNDYWVWKAIDIVRPDILVLEYNSVFGPDRAITVPYDPAFTRTKAHYSNLFQGASLAALCDLSAEKGYEFVGSNRAGVNAYFCRKGLDHGLQALTAEEGYVASRFNDSRDQDGALDHVRGSQRLDLIRGLTVVNTRTGLKEPL